MTFRELQADDAACHRELKKITAELTEARASLADTAKSLLNAVDLAVKYQHERDAAVVTIGRVEAACDGLYGDNDAQEFLAEIRAALTEPKP